MRTREKARIWRRFMAGESVAEISYGMKQPRTWEEKHDLIESILREGLAGKPDTKPKSDWLNTGWRGRAQ